MAHILQYIPYVNGNAKKVFFVVKRFAVRKAKIRPYAVRKLEMKQYAMGVTLYNVCKYLYCLIE